MNSINSSNVGTAFAFGQMGLQAASDGITRAATNIAQRTVDSGQNAPGGAVNTPPNPTSSTAISSGSVEDIISLNVNGINAQASTKVLDTANDMLGTIIDITA